MRTLALVGLTILAAQCHADTCSHSQEKVGQRVHILGIGVDTYNYTTSFVSSEREVRDVVAAFATNLCVPTKQITIIGQSASPTRANILRAYLGTLKRMKKGDYLIFIFAGHGFEGDVFHVLPQDAYFEQNSLEAASATAISLPSLKRIARDYGVSEVFFIFDACRTFPVSQGSTRTTVLWSTLQGAPSYEISGRGLFFPKLTTYLRSVPTVKLDDLPTVSQKATNSLALGLFTQNSTLVVDRPPNRSSSPAQPTGPTSSRGNAEETVPEQNTQKGTFLKLVWPTWVKLSMDN
ncbi:MAG: caspase family protein [Bryobacteraceae bacterium]